jgi:hypothetical protein
MASINHEAARSEGALGCPETRETGNTNFAEAVAKELKGNSGCGFLTIIPSDGQVPYKKLKNFDYLKFKARHQKKLKRHLPKGITVIGAIDVSLTCMENVRGGWAFHFHLITTRPLTSEEMKRLKTPYPNNWEIGIHVAIKQERIKDGDIKKVAAYCLKHFFTRSSKFTAMSKDREPYIATNSERLKSVEDVRLNKFLSQFNVKDPVVLMGVKLKRTKSPTSFRFMKNDPK